MHRHRSQPSRPAHPSPPRPNTLSTIPEELLERILALCITSPEPVSSPQTLGVLASRHGPDNPSGRGLPTSPLLVCKRFLRIATPLFYHTLTFTSRRQTILLGRTLSANPLLASFTRKLVVESSDVYAGAVSEPILRLCRNIDELDVLLLDGGAHTGNQDQNNLGAAGDAKNIKGFCQALARLGRIRRLTLRKPPTTYLTHDRPRMVVEGLAGAVKGWRELAIVTLTFRLSSTQSTDLFVSSLAKSPRLHTLRAVMPTVLNSCFITLSTNPSLKYIELITDEAVFGIGSGSGNGLFLKEARKVERLWALIRRGTPTLRARANTYSTSNSPSRPSSSSGSGDRQQIKATQSMGSLAPPGYSYGYASSSGYGYGPVPVPVTPGVKARHPPSAFDSTSASGSGYYAPLPHPNHTASTSAGSAAAGGYRSRYNANGNGAAASGTYHASMSRSTGASARGGSTGHGGEMEERLARMMVSSAGYEPEPRSDSGSAYGVGNINARRGTR